MKVSIVNKKVWLQGIEQVSELIAWANNKIETPEQYLLPKPAYYPKAQLRRLSPFSKVILHCLDMPETLEQNLPLIFASQHGDLAKTVELIKNVALEEDISPTQFTLSVHNATTGLFGIATNNCSETTTISAGKNTFFTGLVESVLQATQENKAVVYVYCDFPVPVEYSSFVKPSVAHCIALVLSPHQEGKETLSIEALNDNEPAEVDDLSIDFMKKLYQGLPTIGLKSSSLEIRLEQ